MTGYCDDGNSINGDGCDSTCQVETGWICSGGNSTHPDTCIDDCQDGLNMNPVTGYCDDGNAIAGDGCDATCQVETGWTCSGGSSTNGDICTDTCGDGVEMASVTGYCDDGNLVDGDGCSSQCSIETGFVCTGGSPTTPSSCSETCGDGARFTTTTGYCDDGNLNLGDGCNDACQVESGWSCSGGNSTSPDVCTDLCGDNLVVLAQTGYCDDGNLIDGDG